MNWLDTETKTILQKEHDPKLAPAKVAEFALVLLRKGSDGQRLIRAIRRINKCAEVEARELSTLAVPVVVNPGLIEAEVLFGQFELICCDAISVFVRSEIIMEREEPAYLESLFQKVAQSPEFAPTWIEVLDVPSTDAGEGFADQFLGDMVPDRGRAYISAQVPYKKARIMQHWAKRIGATIRCEARQ